MKDCETLLSLLVKDFCLKFLSHGLIILGFRLYEVIRKIYYILLIRPGIWCRGSQLGSGVYTPGNICQGLETFLVVLLGLWMLEAPSE